MVKHGVLADAHVHPSPAATAVPAAEQDTDVALETKRGATQMVFGSTWTSRISRNRFDLGVQRSSLALAPVPALVRAAEQAGAADGKDRPGRPTRRRAPPCNPRCSSFTYWPCSLFASAHAVSLRITPPTSMAIELHRGCGIDGQLRHAGRLAPGATVTSGAKRHREAGCQCSPRRHCGNLAVLVDRVQQLCRRCGSNARDHTGERVWNVDLFQCSPFPCFGKTCLALPTYTVSACSDPWRCPDARLGQATISSSHDRRPRPCDKAGIDWTAGAVSPARPT